MAKQNVEAPTTVDTPAAAAVAAGAPAAPKKRGRKPGSKNKAVKPKAAKKPGRKAAPKKAHTPAPEVYFQAGGKEYNGIAVMERAKADYRATHKAGIHTCKVYIKPEEDAVYYVINKVEGKIPLE